MTASVLLLVGSVWAVVQMQRLRVQVDQISSEQTRLQSREQELRETSAETRTANDELRQQLRQEEGRRVLLEQELALARGQQRGPARAAPTVASYVLTAGLFRSMGETQRVLVPRDSNLIELQLDRAGDDYRSYRAVLGGATTATYSRRTT